MAGVSVPAVTCVARLSQVAAQRAARGDVSTDNPGAAGEMRPRSPV